MTDRRLLIVDDEPDFGEFVRQVAEGCGYQVTVTARGKEFMEAYKIIDPTVVVLDMVMPGIDGTELVQWLADRQSTSKVVIMSGYNPNYAELASKLGKIKGLGSVTNLAKPVTIAHLREVLA